MQILGRVVVVIGCAGLGLLLIVPLGWKEQASLGATLFAVALVLDRLSSSRTVTLALMSMSLFATFRYGYFRVTQTWDGLTSAGHWQRWDTVLVLVLLCAEFYAFLTLVLGYFQTLRPLQRPPVSLPADSADWPTVDVLIPTYNEPLSVVRTTMLGALAMEYPADKMKVYVLDDSKREEFRQCAAAVGARYLTREGNAHAKAGNINAALTQTDGEYVAVFDCDHVPTSSFLQTTVGWFIRDDRLGLVQTPHHFYSPDPFERNLDSFRKVPNEGELFHRLIQDGNDLWNASFFCGSCAVLKRSALEAIGGVAVETVTEDAHTALRMQRSGWNTAYINIPQAAGLATESLAAHIGQRIRWARGMIQILRLENPLLGRGLTLAQRLCYFNASTHFLFALPRLIFLTMPLSYLLFGLVNIYGYSLAVFAYALPHIAISGVTNSRVQGRHRFSFWNEIYETVLAPFILLPTFLALVNPRLGKFNVTSKGGVIERSYFDFRLALPFMLLLGLNIAGLVMAARRLQIDPAHADTIVLNAIWTAYNVVILSVAASVAWERRQRRAEPRLDVRAPLSVVLAGGQHAAGFTSDVSLQGLTGRFDAPVHLARGTPVDLVLGGPDTRCHLKARVAASVGREMHFVFGHVGLREERYLLRLAYLRPQAWLWWHAARGRDHALISLARILWLALRGFVLVPFALLILPRTLWAHLFTRNPARRQTARKRRERIAAALLVISFYPPVDAGAQRAANVASSASEFEQVYEIRGSDSRRSIGLTGAGATHTMFFSVPVTKIISRAALRVHYAAPLLGRGEGRLVLLLNGSTVASLPLDRPDGLLDVPLPTDLLTNDNSLTLQLSGQCRACTERSGAWLRIDPSSALTVGGTRLLIPDDLSLLPIPFSDPASQRSWSLPLVFMEPPDHRTLEAAAMMASWFGVASDVRSVRFPVTIGALPTGNAIVLARRGSALATSLSVPPDVERFVAIRENPRDAYGKLLILSGADGDDLVGAARAFVTRSWFPAGTATASLENLRVPARPPYDAARWLPTNQLAQIGTYTTDERLRIHGSGSVDIYFRLPPDLFLGARDSVPLQLRFTYDGVATNRPAAVHVRLNGADVDSIRLPAVQSATTASEIFRLPTGQLQPYINTLTVVADFGIGKSPAAPTQYVAVHRNSSIDLRRLPHSVVLPRLELFGQAGYPFTGRADLGETAVVVPAEATPADYETLLTMAGFFGAQTGAPATALTVTDAAHVAGLRDKHMILLGRAVSQPLLHSWADSMPLRVAERTATLNPRPEPSRLLHPELPFRPADRGRLATLLAHDPSPDLIVEQFVSPLRADRSVVAIVPGGAGAEDAVAALFAPGERKGPVYGGVSVSRGGTFQSFLLGVQAYRAGDHDVYRQASVFVITHHWLIPAAVVVLALLVAVPLRQGVERTARRRLGHAIAPHHSK
ncbi:MAG TPA: UDP-forming cellulose synthase catalytic subunit [Vicinamibacterales bacterium]|nr:UDP-forming cellulose synthase catalytic subunit [Vicinamibacterales bacterium]